MGSKSSIVHKIAKYFPNAENFYDLFGGGFSITHYMLKNRFNSYNKFFYNEIKLDVCELIKDAISGKYNYDNFKPEWISREIFHKEKLNNAYIRILWSFGNGQENYLYGKDNENIKRSIHQAVIFNEFDNEFIKEFGFSKWPNKLTVTGKRLFIRRHMIAKSQRLGRMHQSEHLQQLERLQRLGRIQQLERKLEITSLDYRNVKIKPNSVIYCDIPYKGTNGYLIDFNHEDFFNWANEQNNPIFISEYGIKDERFFLLKEISHNSTFSGRKKVIERLYGNKIAFDIISQYKKK